jgi:hypothetical protein
MLHNTHCALLSAKQTGPVNCIQVLHYVYYYTLLPQKP